MDFNFSLDIFSVSVSLIDTKPQEFLHFTLDGIQFENAMFKKETQRILIKVRDFQLDNQLRYTKNPVVIFSSQTVKKTRRITISNKKPQPCDPEEKEDNEFLAVDILQDITSNFFSIII